MFKQPMWMIPLGHYLGNISIIFGIYLIIYQGFSPWWLLVWACFHLISSLMLSVGLHRYFSHGTFKTTPFWHKFMSFYSVILLNGSAHGWAAAHNTHHVHSDTNRDPHEATWKYLFTKKYRNVPMVMTRVKVLVKDDSLNFLHRYGAPIWLGLVLLLGLVSWPILLFAYLMPLGSAHMIGAIHQTISHRSGAPRNLAWLEWILPASGEWLHKTHHDHPGKWDYRTKWYHLDLGALFIKLIAVPSSLSKG